MKTIRIGNDVAITWAIVRNGKPEDFRAKALSLFIYSRYGKESVKSFAVNGNSLRFAFLGKSQRYTGDYGLLLVVNEGADGMFSVDLDKAFRITDHSECNCDGVVELVSDLTLPSNGLSAYELAIINGFVGTEQEWLHSLVKPAEDAAALANKAAERADLASKNATATDNAVKLAETGRVSAEDTRQAQETERKQMESERQTAENLRQTQESARQNNTAKAIRDAGVATDAANAAAVLAAENVLSIHLDNDGRLLAHHGQPGAFVKGEITPNGIIELTFNYK